MTDVRPPRDNLVRALAQGFEVSDDGKTLFGRIAPANAWTEIRSSVEGHFMERNAPGAFRKTFSEGKPKILFNHGKDPQLGNQIIAEPRDVGEDEQGGYYRAEILDGVPPLIVDGLKRGLYGSSHTFSVIRETWNDRPKPSDHNPKGLPERTILEARVPELGPVTWPAYADAFAGVRSLTDEFTLDRLAADPDRLRDLAGYVEPTTDDPAPSVDAGDPPHLEPERREDEPITEPITERNEPVTIEYVTRDEKAARVTELRSELSRMAVEFPGVLPEAEQERWDANEKELGDLERDIRAWDERQAKVAAFAAGEGKRTEGPYSAPIVQRRPTVEDIYDIGAIQRDARSLEDVETRTRENAMRSIDAARVPAGSNLDAIRAIVEDGDEGSDGKGEMARRVLLTGSPQYKRAFNKYLRGEQALWSPEESRAAALAVTGTTTTGGYAVPYIFDPTIIRIGAWTAVNPFREACEVKTITNGNNWRTVTVGAATAAYATEAAAATEQGPTFGQPTYTVQRAHAFATVSIETMEDRSDIAGELTAVFAEAKDTLEENQFAVGAGTTVYPMGMFTDTAYTNQDTATNDVTALLDFTVLETQLPLRFRRQAAFFMNRSTIRQLLVLDTTYRYFSGAGIQFPGQRQGTTGPQPESSAGGNTGLYLNGYPIWEVPSAVSTLTTDGAIIAVLCDPKSYIIVDRIGMNVEVIQNMLNGATPSFPTGQRGIYCYWRNTAKPINADAGRSLSVQ